MKNYFLWRKLEQDSPALAASAPCLDPPLQSATLPSTATGDFLWAAALAAGSPLLSLPSSPQPSQPPQSSSSVAAAVAAAMCAQRTGTAAHPPSAPLSASVLAAAAAQQSPAPQQQPPQPTPQQLFQPSFFLNPGANLHASAFSVVSSQAAPPPPPLFAGGSSSFLQPAATTAPPSHQAPQPQPSAPSMSPAAAAAALYPQLMCLPALLDRLGPHILRSHMSTAQFKPIPNNERVDLARFRVKEPHEWQMDDVVAWMLDVARRHQIPFEDINMHKFATLNGQQLLLMGEANFIEREPSYGSLLYRELRKLISGNEDTLIDDWVRAYKEEEASTSRLVAPDVGSLANLGLLTPCSPLAGSGLPQPLAQKPSPAPSKYPMPGSHMSTDYDSSGCGDDSALHGVSSKIRKNKDGKPRKRSQHTKGNKLWEFIRDALRDPSTCPSVVRWEDPIEGVFRIVESEKLARLWGEKKNNTKMTYEKLSRAMRTYYEKQILVPVPKTGLYPKKLVYKFGPSAHGWDMVKREPRM